MWVEKVEYKDKETGKVTSSKYRYAERFEHPFTGKYKKVSLLHTKHNNRVIKDMPALLEEKFNRMIEKENAHKAAILPKFGALCEEWLQVYKLSVKNSSYIRVASNIKSLKEELADEEVDEYLAPKINKFFLTHLKSERYVFSTANQMKSNVGRVLKYAKTYYGVDINKIIDSIEIPKLNVTKKDEYNYLEKRKLKQVISYLKINNHHELMRFVIIQVNTGMRFGELASIDYKNDIDFSANSITISKTYDYDAKLFTSPKTGDERVIFFNADTAKVIKEQIMYTQRLTMSKGLSKSNTLLFKSVHGNVLQHRVLNDKFPKMELGQDVTTHTLRHTFVSLAIEKGVNKELIAKQVGHSDTKMIDEIYAHFTEEMLQQQKEAMLDLKII